MISRKQLRQAYNSSEHIIRRRLREIGVTHQCGLSLEEFREFVKRWGWPLNKAYNDLAEYAMKSPIQARLPLK